MIAGRSQRAFALARETSANPGCGPRLQRLAKTTCQPSVKTLAGHLAQCKANSRCSTRENAECRATPANSMVQTTPSSSWKATCCAIAVEHCPPHTPLQKTSHKPISCRLGRANKRELPQCHTRMTPSAQARVRRDISRERPIRSWDCPGAMAACVHRGLTTKSL